MATAKLECRIREIRGQRVILDSDLAEVYEVQTKQLNQQLKRNRSKFPSDFAFQLTRQELTKLMSQIVTSSLEPASPSPELDASHSSGYTLGMKTAISLPDALFQAAERHAKRESKSRSQLYADALADYLARHSPDEVTEAMNRVVDQQGGQPPDPFVSGAARSTLDNSEW